MSVRTAVLWGLAFACFVVVLVMSRLPFVAASAQTSKVKKAACVETATTMARSGFTTRCESGQRVEVAASSDGMFVVMCRCVGGAKP